MFILRDKTYTPWLVVYRSLRSVVDVGQIKVIERERVVLVVGTCSHVTEDHEADTNNNVEDGELLLNLTGVDDVWAGVDVTLEHWNVLS